MRALRLTPSQESDSSHSGQVNPAVLQERLYQLYDPSKESLDAYNARVDRMVDAMETLGMDVDGDVVVQLKDKAEVLSATWDHFGKKPYKPGEGLAFLRELFLKVALDDTIPREDVEFRSQSIRELILAFGGKESSNPEKLFSS